MFDFPKEVLQIVDEETAANASDIEAATQAAEERMKALPGYKALINSLVRKAIRGLVYAARHKTNVQLKRDVGYYDRVPTVAAANQAVGQVYSSVYDYRIGGTILGELTGSQLEPLARKEEEQAAGHRFNCELMRWLRSQGVTHDKKVKDVVPEVRLRANFNRILKEVKEAA